MPSLETPDLRPGARPAGSPRTGWRSADELERTAPTPTRASSPSRPPRRRRASRRRGFLAARWARPRRWPALAACKPPREKIVSVRPAAGRRDARRPGHYATALALDGHAIGLVVDEPRGAPHQDRGQPASTPRAWARPRHARAGRRPRALRPGPEPRVVRQRAPLAPAGRSSGSSRTLARTHAKDRGARLASWSSRPARPRWPTCAGASWQRFPRARFDAWSAVCGRRGAGRAPRSPSGGRSSLAIDFEGADVILSLDADFLGRRRRAAPPGARVRRRGRDRPGRADEPALRGRARHCTLTGARRRPPLRACAAPTSLAFGRAVAAALAVRRAPPRAGAAGRAVPRATRARAPRRSRRTSRRARPLAGRRPARASRRRCTPWRGLNAALGNVGDDRELRARRSLLDPEAGPERLAALVGRCAAGSVDTLVITAWNPALRRAGRPRPARRLRQGPNADLLSRPRGRDLARVPPGSWPPPTRSSRWGDARARDGTLARPAAHRAALARAHRTSSCWPPSSTRASRGPRARARRLAGARRTRGGVRARLERLAGRDGLGGRDRAALHRSRSSARRRWPRWPPRSARRRRPRAGSRSPSPPTPRSSTAASPTTPGSRSCPTRSPSSPGTTPPLSPGDRAAGSASRTGEVVISLGAGARWSRRRCWSCPATPTTRSRCRSATAGRGRRDRRPGRGLRRRRAPRRRRPGSRGGARDRRTGAEHELAITQEHFAMDGPRHRARAATSPSDARPAPSSPTEHRGLAPTTPGAGRLLARRSTSWGDGRSTSSRCTGCSACVVACQAENNIPVGGQGAGAKGREMHWLRIDRYYAGRSRGARRPITQPLPASTARRRPASTSARSTPPCHTDEGLNEMVYNRCVGTRFCSNNCPYKVRRFNFFDWTTSDIDADAGHAARTPTSPCAPAA